MLSKAAAANALIARRFAKSKAPTNQQPQRRSPFASRVALLILSPVPGRLCAAVGWRQGGAARGRRQLSAAMLCPLFAGWPPRKDLAKKRHTTHNAGGGRTTAKLKARHQQQKKRARQSHAATRTLLCCLPQHGTCTHNMYTPTGEKVQRRRKRANVSSAKRMPHI
jgi:hypothetical protein